MPPLALARMPSLSRTPSGYDGHSGRLSTASASPHGSPRGDGGALPPLPVPLADVRPALVYEPGAAQLCLAAFELLLLCVT
jgi:hypothetical protein